MSDPQQILAQLIELSRRLGEPARDLVILGEGNTSAKVDEKTFFVKASGKELAEADGESFVRVSFSTVLEALRKEELTDEEVKRVLQEARVDPHGKLMPSLETFLHAYLLSFPDLWFVGHTHPAAVNAVLCSLGSREAFQGSLFPDEIVYCGPRVCYVEYTDPGLSLAHRLRRRVQEFVREEGRPPRVILMENHGLIACGRTVREVEASILMFVKASRILLGTYALGGPRFLQADEVARIDSRPDEKYRRSKSG